MMWQILIEVLESIGLDSTALKWFKSFLNGWSQHVIWDGQISSSEEINIGVFQGEGNSQTLFSLFINHLSTYIQRCTLKQFADDTCIMIESNVSEADIVNAIQAINSDLANVNDFSEKFRLKINPQKSKAIIVSSKNNKCKIKYEVLPHIQINQEIIEYVDIIKYLGFNFNRDFQHKTHINTITKKVYYALSQLQHLKYTMPTYIKLNLVKALILPLFDYMDIIYHENEAHGSAINTAHLQKLFNNAIRFVYNLKYNEHITPYIYEAGLLPLHERRETHIASMIHRIINNKAPPYLERLLTINNNNTRSCNKLIVHKPNNNQHKKSFKMAAPMIWNRMDEAIRNQKTIKSFNNSVKINYRSNLHARL
jgi:ribulose bisphosphate carboxylase small subunit